PTRSPTSFPPAGGSRFHFVSYDDMLSIGRKRAVRGRSKRRGVVALPRSIETPWGGPVPLRLRSLHSRSAALPDRTAAHAAAVPSGAQASRPSHSGDGSGRKSPQIAPDRRALNPNRQSEQTCTFFDSTFLAVPKGRA